MKKYSPTTPSRRHMKTAPHKRTLSGDAPNKQLTKGFKRGVGRNNAGRITMRHKGGGHKRRLRQVDFRYEKKDIPARIETKEYDPNRSGYIARVIYADGERRYILIPRKINVGDSIITSENAELKPGNRLPLSHIPVGTFVYNVELKPEDGAKLIRSAGVHAEVVARDGGFATLKMPSTEVRKVPEKAWASVGEVSNPEHKQRQLGKAGASRRLGRRPKVRGAAMNPVDHPYGGGEGRTGRGIKREKTKWGRPAGKGQKTRKPKKYSDKLIVERRKVGKKRRKK